MKMPVAEGNGESRSPARSVVLGTAGHIDHGKTALVLALTGTDTDRLPEEKTRGITIDLGFTNLSLTGEDGIQVEMSIIDVPGHHAFIRNMLAGAGGIDCVMLIVAADDGVKPQTEEHLAICGLLGIQAGLVVLTKKDLVTEQRLQAVREEVRVLTEGTLLHGAPVVEVSSVTGEGIQALTEELARLASRLQARSAERVPRLPVDRCFSVRGFGTVVTGTLQGGALHVGDVVDLAPSGGVARIRGLQVHGQARGRADAPCRVALNVAGVEVSEVKRGEVIAPTQSLSASSMIDVVLSALPGTELPQHRSQVRVHAFAAETGATVLYYGGAPAAGQKQAIARLRLHRPMLLMPEDRLVLRRSSPAITIGGGVVLDAQPMGRRKAQTFEWLQRLKAASDEERLLLRIARRGVQGISTPSLVLETGLTGETVRRMAGMFQKSGRIVAGAATHSDCYVTAEAAQDAAEQILGELAEAQKGEMQRAEVQSKLGLQGWVVEIACRILIETRRVAIAGDVLSLPQRGTVPGRSTEEAEVEQVYREAGLASPLVNEVAAKLKLGEAQIRGAVTALLRDKKLVRLGADSLLVHAEALHTLMETLRKHQGESFDVGWFKSFTGLTRKHAIPLLEHLDGARVTRNAGGKRIVL